MVASATRAASAPPEAAPSAAPLVRFEGDRERADQVYEGLTPLSGEDVADAVAWVVTRPAHVDVDYVSIKISALVDEFYLGRIAPGQTGGVEIAGSEYPLEVAKVYPNVRDRQFQVDLEFDSAVPDTLRRGQTVRPRLELGETADSLVIDIAGDDAGPLLRGWPTMVEAAEDLWAALPGRRPGQVAPDAVARRLLRTHLPVWNDPADSLTEARGSFAGPVDVAEPGTVYEL